MYEQVEKSKENSFPTKRQESRAVANSVGLKKANVQQGFGFVDNRAEAVAQRKLKERANNSPQANYVTHAAQLLTKVENVIQRVQVQDSKDGTYYETTEMGNQEVIGLALQFYQLHNIGELRKIQLAHSDLPITDNDLYQMAYAQPHPRTRKRDNLSDGESENEDSSVVWRSLRSDENIGVEGVRPPVGHDPTISASAHITAGTGAQVKSPWVSATRSRKVAGGWASQTDKRVAKLKIPPSMSSSGSKVFDMTKPSDADKVFPTGKGSSLNTAKSSQELIINGGLGPEQVLALYEAKKISVKEYNEIKERMQQGEEIIIDGHRLYAAFRTRTTVASRPEPRLLLEIPFIRATDVVPLIIQEFSTIENEDGSPAEIPEIDTNLLKHAINKASTVEEAAFLYTDIYFSMDL
jgi:hypothetical protein